MQKYIFASHYKYIYLFFILFLVPTKFIPIKNLELVFVVSNFFYSGPII